MVEVKVVKVVMAVKKEVVKEEVVKEVVTVLVRV